MTSVADTGVSLGTRPSPRSQLWPPARWPLSRRAMGWWVGAYVVMTALWSAAGLLITRWLDDTSVGRADADVARWLADRRSASRTEVSHWISLSADVGSKIVIVVVLSTIFVILLRRAEEVILLISVLLLEVSVFATTAAIVGRDRPPVEQLDGSLPTSSYPSGHVAATTALYVALALIVWRHCKSPVGRYAAMAFAAAWPLVMAVSRMYRGMHFLSDALFGALLGLTSVVVGLALLRQGRSDRDERDRPRSTNADDLEVRQ